MQDKCKSQVAVVEEGTPFSKGKQKLIFKVCGREIRYFKRDM